MKKTLLPLAVIALSLSACQNTPQYTIDGTIEGENTGKIFLIHPTENAMDTLAQTPITDGKFTLRGTSDTLQVAYLTIENKRGFTPVFLENAKYTATLNSASPMDNKIEGTEAQSLANQFTAISIDAMKKQRQLESDYKTAEEAKDQEKMNQIELEYNGLGEIVENKENELIKANPDSYVTAYMIASKLPGMDEKEIAEYYEKLGPNAKASQPGQEIAKRMEKLAALAIGQVAPDFTLNTPEGEALSMHSIKGKVKIIDFWASWCGPCRRENPNVVNIYKKYHPKGLEILSVSLDNNKDKWTEAIEADQLSWHHVSDLQGWGSEAAQLYAVNSIPRTFILDENNVIVAKNLRGEELEEKIAELLQ